MIDNKLTLSDCFKYPNAPLINQLGLKCKNLKEFISATDGQDLDFILQDDGFKLILRDITELTDEEKKYITSEYFFEECPDWTNIRSVFNCSLGFYSGNNSVELADYLREKNIMIEKPDWFATGKAVKDEK